MFKRSALALLGGAALALTSVVGLGSPAQAATGAQILVPITFAPGAYVLPDSFSAGDCRQVGADQQATQIPAYLTIEKSTTASDLYTVTWHAAVYTVSTLAGDVWHPKFVFRSYDGPIRTMVFPDSPSMGSGSGVYHFTRSMSVPLTADQANAVHFVDWIGDC
jgi:hypothetical protein